MKKGMILTILSIVLLVAAYLAVQAKAATPEATPAEPAQAATDAEYIHCMLEYIQFLEGEIDYLNGDYFGDVIVETDVYADYREARENFYNNN